MIMIMIIILIINHNNDNDNKIIIIIMMIIPLNNNLVKYTCNEALLTIINIYILDDYYDIIDYYDRLMTMIPIKYV